MRAPFFLLTLAAFISGCMHEVDGTEIQAGEKGSVTKPEPWSGSDAPSMFDTNLNYKMAELPRTGAAQNVPWASSYWPTYEDSINYKWDANSDSPATKYGRAFNVSGVEDAVSRMRGIDSQSHRTKCTDDTACKSEIGEKCSKRTGKTEGYCVPTWFGICHAWAPAAILTAEPKRPVTVNGVEFKVNDIKALVTLSHDSVVNKFVSLRCERDDRTGATSPVEFDEHGRPKDLACRDSNAGSFHVLLTNYLGIQKASFVFDQTYDDEVWNQPLRDYNVVEQREVTVEEANRILGVVATGGTNVNLAAEVAQGAFKHFDPIAVTAGSTLRVTMSGTGDGDLYVKFGAQPTASSYDCRPYTDGSAETCELTVPASATQAFVSVNGYSAANVTLAVNAGGSLPTTYVFNPNAKKLMFLKTEVRYIGESSSDTDGNLGNVIDRYTTTNRYEYILELDADGKIVGGEWANGSKRMHPDFAWLPVSIRNQSVAGGKITWANVKSLLDQSLATEGGGGGTDKTVTESGTVARGAFKHYGPFNVAAGANLVTTITGDGDADLYVRKGTAPTTASYDCRPYKDGSSESCTVAGPGEIYVSVNGYAASSNFTLTVTYKEGGGSTPPPPPPPTTVTHLNTSGSVALNEYKYFTVNVLAGRKIVVKTTAPKDVDVYLQMNANPTADNAIAQAYTSSGNETLSFVPSSSGTLHIGVHGYEASTFTLVTTD